MNERNFFAELKRRNVYKIAVVYSKMEFGDPLHLALLAAAKTKMGDKNIAQQALAELDKVNQDRQGLAYDRALVYLAIANKEGALRWLEQSYADRDGANLNWINVEPILDPLRGEPRFEALVEKVIAPKPEPKP